MFDLFMAQVAQPTELRFQFGVFNLKPETLQGQHQQQDTQQSLQLLLVLSVVSWRCVRGTTNNQYQLLVIRFLVLEQCIQQRL